MAKLGISTGSSPNDGTGDSLIDGAIKINSNFAEIYTTIGDGSTLAVPVTSIAAGSNISVSGATGNVTITGLANTVNVTTNSLVVAGISTLTGTLNANGGVVGNVTGSSSQVTVSDESSDTTCFPLFTNEATGNLEPKSGTNLTFNSSSGALTATSFSGSGTDISGIVTSITAGSNINVSGATGNVTITGLANTANVATDSLIVAGIATFNNFLRLPSGTFSNNQIQLGDNQDFTLQFNSAVQKGLIKALGKDIDIQADTIQLQPSGSDGVIVNGSVELYNGGSKKFETTGAGVTVFGTTQTQQLNVSDQTSLNTLEVTGVSTFTDNARFYEDTFFGTPGTSEDNVHFYDKTFLRFGDGNDFLIVHAGDTTTMREDGGRLQISANPLEFQIQDVTVATITGAGITVGGGITATGSIQVGSGQSFGSSGASAAVYYGDGSNLTGVSGITTANIKSDTITSGIITATSFVGDGSALTGVVGSGSGIIVRDGGSLIGTAGTIDFGTNLSVSAISAGIVTVTASGGITTANINADTLQVSGVSTFSSDIDVTGAVSGYDYLQAPFSTTVNFTVTVASKTAAHRYNGTGSGNGYVIDGVESPFLTLTPGRTYRFTLSSGDMTSHPFRFYLEADRTTAYTTNVTSTSTYTEIVVTDSTPQVLHYQCTNHAYMGNAVNTNSNVATATGGALQSRTIVTGITTSIENNGIGNTDITGFKSYSLMRVGLSTAGWLRIYADNASRTADISRSIGVDPAPGSGIIAEVVTTGISTTQIITPFVMGGNLNNPADATIYASITNLSGSTQSITANLTILQLEA